MGRSTCVRRLASHNDSAGSTIAVHESPASRDLPIALFSIALVLSLLSGASVAGEAEAETYTEQARAFASPAQPR